MDRRTALAAAGAVVLTVAAGAVAVAANLGLVQQTDTGVGQLQPVVSVSTPPAAAPTDTETIYVDEYVASDVGGPAANSDGSAVPAPSLSPADDLGHEEWDDDAHEDDLFEYEEDEYEYEGDEHEAGEDEEDGEDEYEGGEDDD